MNDTLHALGAQESMTRFEDAMNSDAALMEGKPWFSRWLFADLLAKRGERVEMNFYGYEGPAHVRKFFGWLAGFKFPDFLDPQRVKALADLSASRDTLAAAELEVAIPEQWIANMARYNAQDYLLQRAYPVPDRCKPRVVMDFGAGHGRMANLAFGAPDSSVRSMIVVDAIPSTYLTQRAYYRGLGLPVRDYIDERGRDGSFDLAAMIEAPGIVHIPTWRMDLVPSASVDMIIAVQVLKELPKELLVHILPEFVRILKPGGALYARDHNEAHNPGGLPVDDLVEQSGLALEFRPLVRDREEIHGLPRIWRRPEQSR